MNLMLTQGNALRIPLEDESVHCVVTSPPYWGLRDYGIGDQLGLESTPEQYVENMVAVFREVKRVMRHDSTLWLNMGDSYAGSGGVGNQRDNANKGNMAKFKNPNSLEITRGKRMPRGEGRWGGGDNYVPNLKPKDLCMIPARVALALQADGWWLRDAIPWVKAWMKTDDVPMWDMPVENVLDGSAMPGSQQDRPTTSYEMIFLLTKSQKYYFDPDAIKAKSGAMFRNVWRMNPRSYKGAHFATFTPQLPKYAIQFGTSERGVCPECGAPWERITRSEGGTIGKGSWVNHSLDATHGMSRRTGAKGSGQENWESYRRTDIGWRPTCECKRVCPSCAGGSVEWTINSPCCNNEGYVSHDPIPATVFDPFVGSGTTLQVARQLGRNGIGLDLSLEYLHLARQRLSLDALDAWTEDSDNGKDGAHKNKNVPGQTTHSFHDARKEKGMTDLPMFEELR